MLRKIYDLLKGILRLYERYAKIKLYLKECKKINVNEILQGMVKGGKKYGDSKM